MARVACPACSAELTTEARFCSVCGSPISSFSQMPTGLAPASDRPLPRTPSSVVGRLASSDSIPAGGFAPGAIFAERYRIIGLVGRGGMGEVYRADDLRLGQPVALKFLPAALAADAGRLERFYAEVRTARQVSHPNVCRVYDIGEHERRLFLSMEYVDGEDLATLLSRIGRLPGDKAVEIAQQLCAGLAAAHDKGVLHRDLKPSNVMIDGRGRARITDFGLAATVEEARAPGDVSGTPSYMAPEQFTGRGASVKSDLYALGLVLYEMWTGRRAFDAASVSEIARKHAEQAPVVPSEIVRNIDPGVERVILKCLEKDPADRPPSALQVASQLPGGDPLAAALAAGETPSPAMVAAAGQKGSLSRAAAWCCFAGVVGLLSVFVAAPAADRLSRLVALEKPPAFLFEKAREILRLAGDRAPRQSSAFGFQSDRLYLQFMATRDRASGRWRDLATARPDPVRFWYRQSPERLVARAASGRVSPDDPPEEVVGMSSVLLDGRGSLLAYHAVPSRVASSETSSDPDWRDLFAAAGLEFEKFQPTNPVWAPPVFADRRSSWKGTYPESGFPVRVEAATSRDRLVSFDVVFPWSEPGGMPERPSALALRLSDASLLVATIVAWVGGVILARRNLRGKRGDRRGAFQIAVFFFLVLVGEWLLAADHVASLQNEWDLLMAGVGHALFWAISFWIVYMALEPYVRRRWPQVLISWTRLLRGGFADPLVGRDLLIGILFGIGIHLMVRVEYLTPLLLGRPLPPPLAGGFSSLASARLFASTVLRAQFAGFRDALGILFLYLLARVLARKQTIAVGALAIVFSFVVLFWVEPLFIFWPLALLRATLWILLMLRVGLLASVVAMTVWYELVQLPLRLDPGWLAGPSLFVLLLFAALAFYGFRTALAGQPIFGATPLDD